MSTKDLSTAAKDKPQKPLSGRASGERTDKKEEAGRKEHPAPKQRPTGQLLPPIERDGATKAPLVAAKFTPWSYVSTEPEFPPSTARPMPGSMSRTMLFAELEPTSVQAPSVPFASAEKAAKPWTKVKRALTGGNFRRSGRKPKKLEPELELQPNRREKIDMTPREIEMSGGGLGRRWHSPMSSGFHVPSTYARTPSGSHYDLRTSTIGYFPGHLVGSAVNVEAMNHTRDSRTLSGVKGGAW